MPQAAYPTDLELAAWLETAGFSADLIASLDLEAAMAAGIRTFEERTGRRFLATSETREFDLPTHPRGILDLKADLSSVTSLTVQGTAQVAGTGYRLLPTNAADDGRPYAQVQFARFWRPTWPVAAVWGAVSITGLWGWGATIPDDVWQGMLQSAGLVLFPQIAQSQSGGLEMWSEADVTERYGADPLGSLRSNWRAFLYGGDSKNGVEGQGGIVGIYRRVQVG